MNSNINLRFPSILCLFAVMALLTPVDVSADFFKYKDDSGNLIITNKFEDVPKKYHKRVKVVWDKDLEAKDPLARRQAVAREQFEERERKTAEMQAKQNSGVKRKAKKGETLVIEMDETTGEIRRRFE